jgi:hypothetical protein
MVNQELDFLSIQKWWKYVHYQLVLHAQCTISTSPRRLSVNYRVLKGAACDYAESRVASGGLTLPP